MRVIPQPSCIYLLSNDLIFTHLDPCVRVRNSDRTINAWCTNYFDQIIALEAIIFIGGADLYSVVNSLSAEEVFSCFESLLKSCLDGSGIGVDIAVLDAFK